VPAGQKEEIVSELQQNILTEVDRIPIVDTHEHTMPESDRAEFALDFSILFAHYSSSALVSAGMPPRLLEAARLPMNRYRVLVNSRATTPRPVVKPEREDMSLEERWQAIKPYWEAIRNTAYARSVLIAAKGIFGIDDLNDDTYSQLSQAIADTRKPGWYRHVLKELAGIEMAIIEVQTADVDRELFAPSLRIDHYIAVGSRAQLGVLEEESGFAIHSLDDLVRAMQTAVQTYVSNGAVALKSALAYQRTLSYDKVTRHEAEVAFNRIAQHLGEGPSWAEAKPLQDYMMHQVIRAAIDVDLPIQIHTGLQEGNENIITNSRPTLLVNLFIEYREARFDLFHGGYPYVSEFATLAKNFPNVWPDLCWVHLISPEIGRRQLHELIETVPGNKILAFGGDCVSVEIAYAHARMARWVVARVLAEKVEDGYMDEAEAVQLARKMLRDSPARLFRLPIALEQG